MQANEYICIYNYLTDAFIPKAMYISEGRVRQTLKQLRLKEVGKEHVLIQLIAALNKPAQA